MQVLRLHEGFSYGRMTRFGTSFGQENTCRELVHPPSRVVVSSFNRGRWSRGFLTVVMVLMILNFFL